MEAMEPELKCEKRDQLTPGERVKRSCIGLSFHAWLFGAARVFPRFSGPLLLLRPHSDRWPETSAETLVKAHGMLEKKLKESSVDTHTRTSV